MDQLPQLRDADKGRLIVSFAEASILRNAAKPVTIPLKLWAAYHIARTFESSTKTITL